MLLAISNVFDIISTQNSIELDSLSQHFILFSFPLVVGSNQ
jgi:hypothetical protein